jgi:succinate dehydrogenase / fumarate reductase cytochrome b subunit
VFGITARPGAGAATRESGAQGRTTGDGACMSEAVAQKDHSSYLLDKLHSLSGIIPIGAFLAEHFWSNSYALVSPAKYNQASEDLQTIPWRLLVEALGIWLPLLFHGGYGMWIWWKGKSNAWSHPWMANWLYTLQRWSGIVAFAFIGWHVWVERFGTGGKSTYEQLAQAMTQPYYVAFYLVGVVAASFHLGNGLWNFSCKWGLTVTKRSQRAAGWLGAAVAVAFTVAGILIVAGFHWHWFPLGGYAQ